VERERELEPEPASEAEGGGPRVVRSLEAKPRLRASLLRHGGSRAPTAGAGIEKGAKVRVLEGPFAGKEGLVQELDGNGGARVMLGLLAVRIDVKDLISSAQGRGRPKLSSSHRRPVPVRS
jgi:transcription antitermination factor NusG